MTDLGGATSTVAEDVPEMFVVSGAAVAKGWLTPSP